MKDLELMMNTWRKHACVAVSLFVMLLPLTSCGSSSDDPEPAALEPPVLLSTSPADGAKGIPAGELTVTLIYDQNIRTSSADYNRITVGGATVSNVFFSQSQVTIQLSGLERGRTYELVIPKGVVMGASKVEAAPVTLSFSTVETPTLDVTLCTPNPLPQARKVYDYLLGIYGEKTLSGTMANVNWNIAEAELVHQATGKYPAIAFFDYIHLYASPANWIDYSDTQVAEDWWNAGGLVGAGWHWLVPNVEDGAEYSYKPGDGAKDSDGSWTTTFSPRNATVEGTWENRVVKADLLKMAGYLKLLQAKNIPVIWRPLHEAAGNIYEYTGGTAWFWWGRDGAEAYRKLWIYMFDFFQEQGVNNLIWVWTTQIKDAAFYPGDDYVDIVGRDIYNQKSGVDNAAQYTAIAAGYSRKLVALSECGNVAAVSAQWTAGARWAFFMPWYQYNAMSLDGHEHADTAWWKDAMGQEFVVTRDRLPSLK